ASTPTVRSSRRLVRAIYGAWRCRGMGSVTGPFACPALECSGAAAVDKGLDQGVDGPLDGRCDEDLLEGVLALEGLGRVGLGTVCDASPNLVEDDAGQEAAHY